jgi:hypothetical protein
VNVVNGVDCIRATDVVKLCVFARDFCYSSSLVIEIEIFLRC